MKTEYYVYQLIEPDGDVFYVGKGQKLRMYKHVRDVKAGRIPGNNYELGEQIWKILDAGLKVKYKRVLLTENEQEAYN